MSPTTSTASSPTPAPVPGPSSVASPPECMHREELTAEEQARLPTAKRSVFGFLRHRKSRQEGLTQSPDREATNGTDAAQASRISNETDATDVTFVRLEDALIHSAELEEDYSKDVYRWAVLYENQRGYAPRVIHDALFHSFSVL